MARYLHAIRESIVIWAILSRDTRRVDLNPGIESPKTPAWGPSGSDLINSIVSIPIKSL